MNKQGCVLIHRHFQNQEAGQSLQTPGLELEFPEQQSPRMSSVLAFHKFQASQLRASLSSTGLGPAEQFRFVSTAIAFQLPDSVDLLSAFK